MELIKKKLPVVKDFALGMSERKLGVFAASGCYYMFMSLVPIVMILCCILPYTPFSQNMVLSYVDIYFSEELGDILRQIVAAIYRSNASTITVSILLTLFSASASMKALMKGMDAAYHCHRKENFILHNIRALIYMVLLVAALILSLVIMVYGARILHLLRGWLPDVGPLDVLLSKARYLMVMLMLMLFFTLLYTLMPAAKVAFLHQIPGALCASLVWVVFSSVFSIYVQISDKYGAYGFIGTIMVAMMWIFYCLFFLLIGGYINSYLTDLKHSTGKSDSPEKESIAEETTES